MGYRIFYGPLIDTEPRKTYGRLRSLIASMLLIFALLVRVSWDEGTQIIKEYLLPQKLTATEEAFSELMVDLRDGESVRDALTVFCLSILDEAA